MDVLDLIHHQFFFTANSLGWQPTTSQFFQPLIPQKLALVAAAIHCVLSEYATGKQVTVMFSQDEYRRKLCPSMVMDCITAEATSLINYTWWDALDPPPWHSSAIISAPQLPSVLLSLDWRLNISFSASNCISVSAPPLEWALLDLDQECLYFILDSLPPSVSAMLSIDQLLCWTGAPWPGLAPPNFIPHSSITIITPLAHPAIHLRHSSFPGGAPLFPVNSSYCLSNSILIHHELTFQFQLLRYHKLSQTTLEFNFTHLPGPNHLEIQGAHPAPLPHSWIVCSCICLPWWDGRFNGWHCDYVWLISFDPLATLLFLIYLLSFLNHSSFSLVHLTLAMQTVKCWRRCWVR